MSNPTSKVSRAKTNGNTFSASRRVSAVQQAVPFSAFRRVSAVIACVSCLRLSFADERGLRVRPAGRVLCRAGVHYHRGPLHLRVGLSVPGRDGPTRGQSCSKHVHMAVACGLTARCRFSQLSPPFCVALRFFLLSPPFRVARLPLWCLNGGDCCCGAGERGDSPPEPGQQHVHLPWARPWSCSPEPPKSTCQSSPLPAC